MCKCGNNRYSNTDSFVDQDSKTSCNGICGSQNSCKTTVITPVKIVPITSTEESSNTYSIETKIPGGLGSIYTRQAEGDTAEELVASVHNNLVEIVIDIARSIIGEDYTGPPAFNKTVHLASLQAFQDYFSNVGSADPDYIPVTNAVKKANLDYITQTMYPVFLSIQTHIEDNESSLTVCSAGGSNVIEIKITNCKFCFRLVYN